MVYKEENLQKILESEQLLEDSLNIVKKEYRPYDPGNYLYRILIERNSKQDPFSDEYLELTYTTLIAWNMNSRRASLEEFDVFKESIRENRETIEELRTHIFHDFNNSYDSIFSKLVRLYSNLKLSKTKSKIVTFTKTLHFLIPHLIVPIDRKYTLTFFYNTTQINTEKQLQYLDRIVQGYMKIENRYNLNNYIDETWNLNIPKTLDNIIIGYRLIQNKKS